jgi:phosphate transport system substrate-binding protein
MVQRIPPTLSFSFALFAIANMAGCANHGTKEPTVTIDGSSTVFPITDAVAHQFQKRNPVKIDVKIPVGISGTGGGFKKFCIGRIDIADASRPINRAETELCATHGVEYIEVPIAYDGLAVVVNPKNTWASDITTAELKKIWEPEAQGRVTKWSQVRADWPEKELHLYGAGGDSGTYDYFTGAIVGKEHSSRPDFRSSENDDVLVKAVAEDELALGFFGYSYLFKNPGKLKALGIDDGNASNGVGPVAPSAESVRTGTYQPLSRPLFIYVNQASLARREVELFVGFYLSKAPSAVERVGNVPLPESAYRLAHERVIARKTGSLFPGGSQIGMPLEELLRRGQVSSTHAAADSSH